MTLYSTLRVPKGAIVIRDYFRYPVSWLSLLILFFSLVVNAGSLLSNHVNPQTTLYGSALLFIAMLGISVNAALYSLTKRIRDLEETLKARPER
jgi:hypothetical protein